MEEFSPSDLKTILHSKRANLYYLEHCRLLVKDGRVEYVTEQGKESLYWNIPIANTTSILLGTGTSITQAAMRELAKAGVSVGFCGGGGTPLFSGTEQSIDIAWMLSQSEYRPTEYLQRWVKFWFDESSRLEAAKIFQCVRLEQVKKQWLHERIKREDSFSVREEVLLSLIENNLRKINQAASANELLLLEASLTKELYKVASSVTKYGDFSRAKHGSGTDLANRYLDHGNYLAYGLAATATWVLGLPHGLAVLHGKTRRGGLVFDIADLVKDSTVLPAAFISAMSGEDESEFRQRCIKEFNRTDALDVMIDTVKDVSLAIGTHNS